MSWSQEKIEQVARRLTEPQKRGLKMIARYPDREIVFGRNPRARKHVYVHSAVLRRLKKYGLVTTQITENGLAVAEHINGQV